MDELVAIAAIARPKGLKGEVFADVLTDFPERFDDLEAVTAVLNDSARVDLKIENVRFQNGRLVLKFAGYDSVEAAETLRCSEICVPESEAVELESGQYFDWQLEGCRVETIEGKTIGKVREVQRTGGTENLLVDGDGKDHLIPFAASICVEVDVENKLIKVDLPNGLLEF
jgi:16S rRNA processing protein RimM